MLYVSLVLILLKLASTEKTKLNSHSTVKYFQFKINFIFVFVSVFFPRPPTYRLQRQPPRVASPTRTQMVVRRTVDPPPQQQGRGSVQRIDPDPGRPEVLESELSVEGRSTTRLRPDVLAREGRRRSSTTFFEGNKTKQGLILLTSNHV